VPYVRLAESVIERTREEIESYVSHDFPLSG